MTGPLTQRLARNRHLVLGRAGMDLYADPPGTEIPHATAFVAHLGGSAANIAVALARQGAQAALLTRLSDDAVGRFCLTQLDAYGIDRTHIRMTAADTRTSLAVVETRPENCQSVIYRNNAADFALTPDDVAQADFSAYDSLIITGTALAHDPSRTAAMAALTKARAEGLVTIMDIDFRPYSWPSRTEAQAACLTAARLCDIIVGNDVEFGLLAGTEAQGLAAARQLVAETATLAVYKRGELGAVTITPTEEFPTGIYRTKALKPTGAGDAFMGGFLTALAQGRSPREATLRGAANAAMVVARVGCAPAMPTTEDLDHFLATHPDP